MEPKRYNADKFMQMLIDHGADVNTTDVQNHTLLHYAAYHQHDTGATWILSMTGLDIVAKEDIYGNTALDIAVMRIITDHFYYGNPAVDKDLILEAQQTFDPEGMLSD